MGLPSVPAEVGVAVGEAVATGAVSVATNGVSVLEGVRLVEARCDADVVPHAAVSITTMSGNSRRREVLTVANHRDNAGRRHVLSKGALRVRNNPNVQHRRSWSGR